MTKNTHFGYVAVVGPTNAGKSTLLNVLAGAPIASVSHKVQTTDRCIYGINTTGGVQTAFIDTPGFFVPHGKTTGQSRLMRHISYGIDQSHVVLVVVDGKRPVQTNFLRFLRGCLSQRTAVLAINKVDALKQKDVLLPLISAYDKEGLFEKVVLISALKNNGVDSLMSEVAAMMPEGPWMYEDDSMTTLSGKELAVETLRGAVFARFNKEIPYATTVKLKSWERCDDGSIVVTMDICVENASHKKILIGKNGSGVAYMREHCEKRFGRIMDAPVKFVLQVFVCSA